VVEGRSIGGVIERMGDTPDATRSRLLLAEIDLCTQQA
jgi:hypothetical protein